MSNANSYNQLARLLHWLVVGLLVLQFVLAEMAEGAGEQEALVKQLALLAFHKSLGLTIALLAFARIGWRLLHPPPELPANMVGWQMRLAQTAHLGLYGLLVALPVSGWLMSSASAYSVSWFNWVQLPDLVGPDPGLKESLEDVHELLASLLLVMVVIHVLAAFKHLIFDRDGVMSRMWSSWAFAVSCCVSAGTFFLMTQDVGTAQKVTQAASTVDAVAASHSANLPTSDLPYWDIDYANSSITFAAEQAGAPFTGVWRRWDAQIQFDPEQLQASRARVVIDTAGVATEDAERDATLKGGDFFAAQQFPQAVFEAISFAPLGEGFIAKSNLRIKTSTQPIDFEFRVVRTPTGPTQLSGTARLDRLAFDLGIGDWSSTEWVGQYVDVHVKITALTP